MRFRRLDLIRYGPFTDRRLGFRDGAALHLVHGPNEAGKSVALAALSDLLYGFPHVIGQDWLHPAADLRLGAEIAGEGGRTLAFRRRRGRIATLRADDAAETPLPEDALAPFLQGVTRVAFERAFGLDPARLAEGARLMLDPEGGEGALFAAAAGLSGVLAASRALAAEADGLYGRRRAKDRRFFRALDAWEAARAEERAATLGVGEWQRLNAAVAAGRERLEGLGERRRVLALARGRLELGERLRPLLAAAAEARAALAPFADLAPHAEGLGAALAAALAAEAQAAGAARTAAAALARAAAEVGEVEPDAGLLAAGEAVTALFAGVGNWRKAAADLPRVKADEAGRAAELANLARRVGAADPGALAAAQPADAALAALDSVLAEGERVVATRRSHADRLGEATAQVAAGAAAPEPQDPAPWARALEALGPDLDRLAAAEALDRTLAGVAAAIASGRAALVPPLPAATDLAALALPEEAVRAAAARAVAAAEAEAGAAAAELARLAAEKAAAEAELAEAEEGGPLPARAAIATARGARDDALAPLLARVAAGEAAEPASLPFRGLVAEADRLADAAFAAAGRVSRAEAARAALARIAARREEAGARGSAAREERATALAGWAAALAPLGVAAAAPAAMQGWLVAAAGLRERARAAAGQEDERAALDRLAATLAPPLAEIARGLGGIAATVLAPAAAARALAGRIAQLRDERRAWEKAAAGRAEAARIRAQARVALARAEAEEEGWRGRYREALKAAGLDPAAAPPAARAAAAAWRDLPPLLRERASLRARAAGMERDMEAFCERARALAAARAPDLAGLSPDAIAEALNRRLVAAREVQATRIQRERARADRAREEAAAAAVAAAAADARAELAEGLPEGADLAALALRLQARDAAAAAAAVAGRQIDLVAPGADGAALAAEVAACGAAEAALRLEAVGREDAALAEEEREAFAGLREAERACEAAAGAAGAEAPAFARAAAEAEAAAAARDWVVRKLAASLLARLIEDRRAAGTGALLARAGALFARLPGAAFAGLATDFDADGRPRLVARRAGGAAVGVGELSQGTRDQLFLALRLAQLEDHADRAGPMPFIGDDLFQTFDDSRSVLGLEVLAEVGARFQVILFTHHEAIVAAAGRAAGAGLDLIRL
ncbi:MAG: AAA family ATPase [Rhodobacteraceae bacterium]|nr:AAA family ATPase [Paracoccaceae bacterium]